MPPRNGLTTEGGKLTSRLLQETREELARADGKASILLAAALVVVGAIVAGIISNDWSPTKIDAGWTRVAWWLGAALAGVSLVSLGAAVFPRLKTKRTGRLAYFMDVTQHDGPDALVGLLNAEAQSDDRDVDQLWHLSKIARRKYRSIQTSEWAMLGAGVLCLFAVLAG